VWGGNRAALLNGIFIMLNRYRDAESKVRFRTDGRKKNPKTLFPNWRKLAVPAGFQPD